MTEKEEIKLDREIAKLDLEAKNLRKKNTWEGVAPVISVATVLLTVTGLIFGFSKWLTEQELQRKGRDQERAAQYQNQLRSDLSELSRFTQDKTLTLSRVSFLMNDLTKTIAIASQDPPIASQFQGSERTVTTTLLEQVRRDTDFIDSSRDVSYATNIAKNWKDYGAYLKQDDQLDALDGILYQHVRALRNLHDKNKEYFDKLIYDVNLQRYRLLDQKAEASEGEEAHYQHFKQLLEGFKEHLSLLADTPKAKRIKEQQIWAFGEAVCHQSVAQYILGKDFVRTPCMPKDN